MGMIEDGWKRIIRKLEQRAKNEAGYISLIVENEDLGNVPPDTWVSPTTAVQIGDAKLFDYSTGSVVYIGEPDVVVSLENYQAVTVSGGGSKTIQGTGGADGIPCENFAMFGTSANNVEAVAINQCRFTISNGDTLDAFVKHNEGGNRNLDLIKGVYHVKIIDVL